MNFYQDWLDQVVADGVAGGFTLLQNESHHDFVIRILDHSYRHVTSQPRKVHEPKGLMVPPPIDQGYHLLKQKLEEGADVSPHLSTSVTRERSRDGMLNDWGIHHFHLGTAMMPNGFIQRTGPLLYARVLENDVYVIDIADHNEWSCQRFIQVLHENWPSTLDHCRLAGVLEIEQPVTDEDIGLLRESGTSSLMQMPDGTVYCGPNLGVTTAGTSVRSALLHDQNAYATRKLQRIFEARLPDFKNSAMAAGKPLPEQPQFKFGKVNGEWWIAELSTGFSVRASEYSDRSA